MQYIFLFCVLCILILQQTINVTSFVSFLKSSDMESGQSYATRRLRAPLMGRSIIPTENNDIDLTKNDTSSSGDGDLMKLNRRRLLLALLNRHKWINSKRRGPLFG